MRVILYWIVRYLIYFHVSGVVDAPSLENLQFDLLLLVRLANSNKSRVNLSTQHIL
jgi:hypothetical protein